MRLDKSFYGEDLLLSGRLWLEKGNGVNQPVCASKRIGMDYAGAIWANKKYRFYIGQ